MFTMHGRIPEDETGHEYAVNWKDGGIDGDPIAVEQFRYMEQRLQGLPLGPAWGDLLTSDYCADPYGVQVIASRVFMTGWRMTGDIPTVPAVPANAIA